jgi:conjugative relaxase-like TrwC/TraI family protein
MLTIRAMSSGAGYCNQHLEQNDYYAEKEKVIGLWHGNGAKMLGLDGIVCQKDFEALRQGIHPENGAFIRQRQSADRLAPDGTIQSHGRNLYDFTISAPKSVSIMAILGDDPRLAKAHEKAVTEALNQLESYAAARVRIAGANENRITGNMAIAIYHHDASRQLDPQLHSHAEAANLTFDDTESRWKALQASDIYERRAYLTEVYRNALAKEVKELGYEIENKIDRKGKDIGFEIKGVPDALMKKYSQRSKQRDEAVAKFTEERGRSPTDNEIATLVRDTRPDKLANISTEQVRQKQMERMEPDETKMLKQLKPQTMPEPIKTIHPEPSLQKAKEHVFERVSVAKDHEVLTESLRHARGELSHKELKDRLMAQEKEGRILRRGPEIATKESLAREQEMIKTINKGIGNAKAIDEKGRFAPDMKLNQEQKDAVQFALKSRDQAINISGAAGTGKTAMLQELRRGILESGKTVMAIAPTRSAVEELQKVGFKDATTIERLLQDPKMQKQGGVLIIDEAGMVSSKQMSDLLKYSEKQSCRIIFSGDTKQIQSVEAGDALRILEKESRLKTVSLTTERRQLTAEYRDAVHQLRNNPNIGFSKLHDMGAILEVREKDRAETVAKTFSEFAKKNLSTLVVCPTHEEIGRVTVAIRKDLKLSGKLGADHKLARDVPLNWTAAHKADISRLQPGQILGFHRSVKGIDRNEALEVIKVEKGKAIAINGQGQTRIITSKQAKSFDVFERQAIEIASGDKLLLTANRKGKEFSATNGEIVTVSKIDPQNRIHLQDGRILPKDYRQFSHGYAVTAHRSQGKTVDAVIISGDGMKKELFYVAASRGREGLAVVTSDKARLQETIVCSMERESATELARNIRPGLHQGYSRGMEVARHLADWASKQAGVVLRVFPALRPILGLGMKLEGEKEMGLSL